MKLYKTIREKGGWECWQVIPIEEYECNNRREIALRERFWYDKLEPSLNTQKPARTKKEHNNERHQCECGFYYTNSHKQRHYRTERHKKYLSIINEPLCQEI